MTQALKCWHAVGPVGSSEPLGDHPTLALLFLGDSLPSNFPNSSLLVVVSVS